MDMLEQRLVCLLYSVVGIMCIGTAVMAFWTVQYTSAAWAQSGMCAYMDL